MENTRKTKGFEEPRAKLGKSMENWVTHWKNWVNGWKNWVNGRGEPLQKRWKYKGKHRLRADLVKVCQYRCNPLPVYLHDSGGNLENPWENHAFQPNW